MSLKEITNDRYPFSPTNSPMGRERCITTDEVSHKKQPKNDDEKKDDFPFPSPSLLPPLPIRSPVVPGFRPSFKPGPSPSPFSKANEEDPASVSPPLQAHPKTLLRTLPFSSY